ncbi:Ig-like domain-containing protein [Aureitalea marina]|uniref:Cytochrome c domain-containing protein n=1 Tax=Aureitalea marina TaxID=930804 RepID=A0A2S7KS08_9FLAO|nr:cadherin-like domain-containing protein [Aureitalea marina]PQB05415.1 hypothetical protein BST85_11325 [Aureitalea marina]
MKKKLLALGMLSASLLLVISCGSDDSEPGDTYVPIVINTNPDEGEVFQNSQLEIDVLANDSNVPATGELRANSASSGSAQVMDPNGTPENPRDDVIMYTPDGEFSGEISFTYTICDEPGRSCATETVTVNVLPFSPVNYRLEEWPFETLTEYNFFDGTLSELNPVYGVLPYEPISTLFTDYAKKSRQVWMPYGTSATYDADGSILNFPIGTALIKTFYYENVLPAGNQRIIETRLMILKEEGWIFADYIWNDEQNEGFLDTVGDGGFVELDFVADGENRSVNYRIPATSQCLTCHKNSELAIPIGVKPQNLNSIYSFEDGMSNQLDKWVDMGYISGNLPSEINTVVDWTDESLDMTLRVRSYLDINCAHCHTPGGHCDYRPLRLAFDDSDDLVNMGVCVDPQTPVPGFEGQNLINPGDAENSILFFRMSTQVEQYRMPLLGRSLTHDANIDLMRDWINSLDNSCD